MIGKKRGRLRGLRQEVFFPSRKWNEYVIEADRLKQINMKRQIEGKVYDATPLTSTDEITDGSLVWEVGWEDWGTVSNISIIGKHCTLTQGSFVRVRVPLSKLLNLKEEENA